LKIFFINHKIAQDMSKPTHDYLFAQERNKQITRKLRDLNGSSTNSCNNYGLDKLKEFLTEYPEESIYISLYVQWDHLGDWHPNVIMYISREFDEKKVAYLKKYALSPETALSTMVFREGYYIKSRRFIIGSELCSLDTEFIDIAFGSNKVVVYDGAIANEYDRMLYLISMLK
jgi:hypothetical protein